MRPKDPLRYPPHYPPTDKWKRFFIGVRWLGPDLSFFKQLASQQQARTSELMNLWGAGIRQQTAVEISVIFARHLRWQSAYFLPDDNVGVIAGGPSFGIIDGDLNVEEAIDEIEKCLGVSMLESFWRGSGSSTLGEVVDKLLAAGAKPNKSR